jgi:hypothetical protein
LSALCFFSPTSTTSLSLHGRPSPMLALLPIRLRRQPRAGRPRPVPRRLPCSRRRPTFPTPVHPGQLPNPAVGNDRRREQQSRPQLRGTSRQRRDGASGGVASPNARKLEPVTPAQRPEVGGRGSGGRRDLTISDRANQPLGVLLLAKFTSQPYRNITPNRKLLA